MTVLCCPKLDTYFNIDIFFQNTPCNCLVCRVLATALNDYICCPLSVVKGILISLYVLMDHFILFFIVLQSFSRFISPYQFFTVFNINPQSPLLSLSVLTCHFLSLSFLTGPLPSFLLVLRDIYCLLLSLRILTGTYLSLSVLYCLYSSLRFILCPY